MRKYILFTLMTMVLIASANPVGRQQARRNAAEFLNKRQYPKGKLSIKLAHEQVLKTHEHSYAVIDTAFYIFNVGADEGFIIVSGDDAAPQVLGYCEKGHFNQDSIPDNLRAWMEGCSKEMEWLKKRPMENKSYNASQTTVRNRIKPLLNTEWGQDLPYNATMPQIPSNGQPRNYYTGCVATAMAQIMYYYKWPDKTREIIEGYTTTDNGNEIEVEPIPANTSIDWDKMKKSYSILTAGFYLQSVKAVAELMRFCATAVKSQFKEDETSATLNDAAEMLVKKFGYSTKVKGISREDYDMNKWFELIYNELKEGRPVLYRGNMSSEPIGHAFIVDGYDGDERYHINWGWRGDYDGYFILTMAKPYAYFDSTMEGYSMNQYAVINICPDNGNIKDNNPAGLTFEDISTNDDTISFGIIENLSESGGDFELTVATIDDNGTTTPVSDIKTVRNLDNNSYISNISFTVKGLTDGIHKIVPVSRKIGSTTWICNVSEALGEYVEAHVIGGIITLYIHQPICRLEVTNISFPGSLKASETQPVKVKIDNLGDEFYGLTYLFASKTEDKGEPNGPVAISVTKGGRVETTLHFTPPSDGKYNIWVTTDSKGNQVIGQSNVTINPNDNSFMKLNMTVNNLDEDTKHLLGSKIETSIKVENPTHDNFSGQVGIMVYCYKGNDVRILSSGKQMDVKAGSTNTATFSLEIDSTLLQQIYREFAVVPFYNKGDRTVEIEGYKDTRYTIISALTFYTSDGEKIMVPADVKLTVTDSIAAVDLRGNTTTTDIAVENANCLFITDSESTPIPGLHANVIKDGVAEEVILSDSHPFYSPVDFMAKKISYTRVFDIGTDGYGGWTTIVLPFDVQKVTVEKDGNEYKIDWFHSNNDQYKYFWVKEFCNDNNKTIYYSYTQEMTALKPYIIAVPNDRWGNANNLTGKPVTFSGEYVNVSSDNNAVISGVYYKFKGVFNQTPLHDIFFLNENGTRFVRGNTTILPFRAYITNTTLGPSSNEASINIRNMDTDHIENIQTDTATEWYTVTGIRTDKPVKKGLYVSKGKKIVVVR